MLLQTSLIAPRAFLAAGKHGVMRRFFNTFLNQLFSEGLFVPRWPYRCFMAAINSFGQPVTCRRRIILGVRGLTVRDAQQLAPRLLKIIRCVIVTVAPVNDGNFFGSPNYHS